MRTSSVGATTSSTFRNEQQYLHAGDLSHNFSHNAQQRFKKSMQKMKDKKLLSKKRQIQQQSPNKIEAAFVDSEDNVQIHNELHETAGKLSRLSKQMKRHNSYRTSI
ncbi:NAD synthetase [Lysinibacillus sp. NPDC097279]|uniref:NAD synthetase n=1 Tax=unclassified Lysinibacillus TaxID=2636778 RepID=UPI0011200225|nr:NAD synthetase [Lysinibacillus sp. CD3-6]QPQ34164.1 NAD synthetase [Lysinibacillus sp. JNUCC-52]UED79881.1 NAD synthetase [Lysinibacillus sp. CD3-6]